MTSALSLLLIGMITVFVVLSLVVFTGNMLIRFVNMITPDQQPTMNGGESGRVVAAISAAVDIVTQGEGKVTSIEKKNE